MSKFDEDTVQIGEDRVSKALDRIMQGRIMQAEGKAELRNFLTGNRQSGPHSPERLSRMVDNHCSYSRCLEYAITLITRGFNPVEVRDILQRRG